MAGEQTTIFPENTFIEPTQEALRNSSTFLQAATAYRKHMEDKGFSLHTVKAFSGDLRLAQRYLGADIPLDKIDTEDLKRFMYWLEYERGVPCSPKSYARRLTTLKGFFNWLVTIQVLAHDPAAKLIHKPISSPLPLVLNDEEVDRLLDTTARHMNTGKKDPRPHLLANLILQTGMKKAECMRLVPADFEDSDPEKPTVLIRYQNQRQLHKERRLPVTPELMETLDRYLDRYRPEERVFECTPRNLEYVLTEMANEADLSNSASFETLRWTCTLRDFQAGLEPKKLKAKLGLSGVTFRESMKKLEKLAAGETNDN